MRLAMWSGPRNLSTAMMYAFGNRVDTAIVDEPYYGAYLHHSGVEHPMNAEVLSSLPHEPEAISAYVTGPVPDGLKIWYQKQLTHHMLAQFSLDWVAQQENVFLIREPARVIASYERKRETLALEDLGVLQQKRIYDYCVALGQSPIVLDSDDILADPPAMLAALCA
ncbi:HAD family hydrolase, partial [Planktomarina sp.]|nr:HAD family hydrolase [Planktomarina sp.]